MPETRISDSALVPIALVMAMIAVWAQLLSIFAKITG